jgi:hypothetical protein
MERDAASAAGCVAIHQHRRLVTDEKKSNILL